MGLLDNRSQNTPSGLPTAAEITEAAKLWRPDPKQFELSEFLPDEVIDAQTAEWDEESPILGMAQDHIPGTPIPLIKRGDRTTRSETSFYIQESGEIEGREFERVRATNSPQALAGEELVMDLSERLHIRRETRKEWMKAQAIANGTVTFNGRTVTYNIPSDNKPTAATVWSNTAAADPIANIQAWLLLLRGVTDGGVTCRMSIKVAQYLARNEMLRDLFRQSGFGIDLGPTQVPKLLSALCGDGRPLEFKIYDKGYKDESTGNFTSFLGDTKFVMIAKPVMGQKLGTWTSTGSIANAAHGSFDPKGGPFVIVDDKLRSKEMRYEMTMGENGMVCLKHGACLVQATIHA
jgi:hypothetical protein